MTRRINDAGLSLIKTWEGCKLTAYRDVGGIWTIGYGHIRTAREGMTITAAQADALLRDDLARFEACVAKATAMRTPGDNEFAAMVSLAFNIGEHGFRNSTVLKWWLAGDAPEKIAEPWAWWNKVDGKFVQGLANRRKAEVALFLTPDASAPVPAPRPPSHPGLIAMLIALATRLFGRKP